MNVLRSLEDKIAGLVEGTFGRVFRSEVRPIELAHKLAREMDRHRQVSVSRVYAPNEFVVWLSPEDRARYDGVEGEVVDELCAYLLEHARRERLALASAPVIIFHTDKSLSLGEFGIQARLVRDLGRDGDVLEQAEHSHTAMYSTDAGEAPPPVAPPPPARAARALLLVAGKRLPVTSTGFVIGRSRDCDLELSDVNVSRRHAEIRRDAGGWTVADLGSTNGTYVNGVPAETPLALSDGDHIVVGTTEMVFEVR